MQSATLNDTDAIQRGEPEGLRSPLFTILLELAFSHLRHKFI